MAALVAPGPRVTNATPWLTGQLRVRLGHERCTRFVAIDDELDHLAGVIQRVEHRQITFAGDAKSVVDALYQQLIDEQASSGARGHGSGV